MPISTAGSILPWPTATSTKRCATFAATLATPSRHCLFLNNGKGSFRDVAGEVGGGFEQPKVGRGLAYADFDRDGDLDLLLTTNNGPAYLYRNDQLAGNHSIRFRLVGTKSNRDANRRNRPHFLQRLDSVAHGEERFQLSVAIRTSRLRLVWRNAIAWTVPSSPGPAAEPKSSRTWQRDDATNAPKVKESCRRVAIESRSRRCLSRPRDGSGSGQVNIDRFASPQEKCARVLHAPVCIGHREVNTLRSSDPRISPLRPGPLVHGLIRGC